MPSETTPTGVPLLHRVGVQAALGLLAAGLVVALGPFPEDEPQVAWMAGVAVLMASWWITEVIPLAVTSLLPLVLLPALGIADLPTTADAYSKPVIFLFLGGFLLALALERSGLHRRIALAVVDAIGSRPRNLILGFMLASAGLSMWISNTASVMVMLPIAMSVLAEAKEAGTDESVVGPLGTAIMLGVAYAADIGGMATPVGTPPNLVLMEMQGQLFPDAPPITFGAWMMMGLPLAVVFLAAGWYLLANRLYDLPRDDVLGEDRALGAARESLGPLRRDEVLTGLVFGLTAALWVTGADLQLGPNVTVPGWRGLLGLEAVGDASVAIAAATLLFMIPSKDRAGETLMDWPTARHGVPWGLLLLFGGGFALAAGFAGSGLSALVGSGVGALGFLPTAGIVVIVCVVLTFLTELTSNTATTTLVLPVLASAAVALAIDPRLLMIPATLSASCAFMMPVASPTQAIIFGSGAVTIRQMVRAGIWFNLLGVFLVTLIFLTLGQQVFDIDWGIIPDWATHPGMP